MAISSLLAQDPTFIERVAEARLPLAALVLTMNLTVALEVQTLFIVTFRNSPVHILLMSCPKFYTMNLTVSHFYLTIIYPIGTI